jgi:hypothetical protein
VQLPGPVVFFFFLPTSPSPFFFFGSQLSREACIFILLSVNVRANSKDLTTEEMRKLIERSVK